MSDKSDKLTPLQYEVTQCDGTEPPFNNEFWNHKEEGIYVDIVSGEALFCSLHKYDSKTGWPSFYQALDSRNIIEKPDYKLLRIRTEVRSKNANSHLGHVFDDGPQPSGKRYCINSAALRFVPKKNMAKEGYGDYLNLFSTTQENIAYFAGGCFWCVEADFHKIPGVLKIVSGYMGGQIKNPSYKQVCTGTTGHVEAIEVHYNEQIISFDTLLKFFWLSIDPTVKDKQFCDTGSQYQSVIFYQDDVQKEKIEKSTHWLKENYPNLEILTQIKVQSDFYAAENYHQNYCNSNPSAYQNYRKACGRDATLERIYGDKRKDLLKQILSHQGS